jgi:DNA-directed RNA polymerase beta' subunit
MSKSEKQVGIRGFEKRGMDAQTKESLGLVNRKVLTPNVIRSFLRELWKKDGEHLRLLFPFFAALNPDLWEYPTDALFIEVLPVPPPKVRPMSFSSGTSSAHATTEAFRNVVVAIQSLAALAGSQKEASSSTTCLLWTMHMNMGDFPCPLLFLTILNPIPLLSLLTCAVEELQNLQCIQI